MNKKRLMKHFMSLIAIDSPTGEEEKIANYLVEQLQALGILVQQDAYGNVYARHEGRGDPLFFSAHMDTVEPGRNIKPRVENGYVVSDKTTILGSDDKVGIVAILEMLANLPKNSRTIECIFTRSEEVGNYGAIHFDYSLLQAKKGYCFDLSQPVGTIASASPFYERFDMTLVGRSAHASHPEEAKNVLPALSEIIAHAPLGKVNKNTYFNIGVVNGGEVRNTILGQVTLKGEIRSFVEEKLQLTKETFRKKTAFIAKKYNLELREDWVLENPGYLHHGKSARQHILQTKKDIERLGFPFQLLQTAGVSDANIFNDRGFVCLNLGDGSEFSHTVQERVKVVELEKLAQLTLALASS